MARKSNPTNSPRKAGESAPSKATNTQVTKATTPETAPALTLNEVIDEAISKLSPDMSMATVHNVLTNAQRLAAQLPTDDLKLVQSESGYNCGGFRKPLLQMVAGAIGVQPILVYQDINPQNPKQVGQQPAFYGEANRATLASRLFTALFHWANVKGNRALRDARKAGREAGKSGQAGDRLQVNVYNDLMCVMLAGISTHVKPIDTGDLKTSMIEALKPQASKGGIVFDGAYDTGIYDGQLMIVK